MSACTQDRLCGFNIRSNSVSSVLLVLILNDWKVYRSTTPWNMDETAAKGGRGEGIMRRTKSSPTVTRGTKEIILSRISAGSFSIMAELIYPRANGKWERQKLLAQKRKGMN